tara:strand:+ start:612 stop:1190 length:579 start_codon:yes stop_codon:yes gene_type:complete
MMATSHQQLSRLCAEAYQQSDFEESNIEVVVKNSLDGGVIFAFRGTDEPADAIRDLRILPLWTRELGWCPAGFLKASRRLVNKVTSTCLEHNYDATKIELTGHSLGGAVALITGALMMRDEIKPRQIVTFGAPRCGRLKILDKVRVTMYRNGKDIVPLVPPLMRRHKPLVERGEKKHMIRDHYALNYVRMPK